MKEFANGGTTPEEQFFGYCLSSAKLVIECAFGCAKARFGCLRRDIDINFDDLSYVIQSCFALHNFCEINKEVIKPHYLEAAKKFILIFSQQLQLIIRRLQDLQLIITNYMERK